MGFNHLWIQYKLGNEVLIFNNGIYHIIIRIRRYLKK